MRRKSVAICSDMEKLTPLSASLMITFFTFAYCQFEHQHSDRFDEILNRFRSITGANCAARHRHELFMPMEAVSHIPNIKELYINPLFPNRTDLVHVHNLALNRAYFYSYLFREAEDPEEPGMMYYYLSHLADVASSKAINASAIYFDTNSSYPNWYRDYFNRTFPLFAPRAVRGDNFNDPVNPHRYSTLVMTDIRDLGVTTSSTSNYTHPLYRINDWFKSWLPDRSGADYGKVTYTVNLKYGNGSEKNIEFFGPPEALADPGPVKWTAPYFDCGRTNKWLIAAVAPVADLYPRHTSWRHLQRHKYVAAVVMETDLLKVDVNQCSTGPANPAPNWHAGTDRCKAKTTECEPLQGYGLKRGGYLCRCRPGFRLPFYQTGPYMGEMIERAIEAEYEAKFDCERIGNIRTVTRHIQSEEFFLRSRGKYTGPVGGERPYSYLFGLDIQTTPEGYQWPLSPKTSNISQFYNIYGRPLGADGRPIIYGPDGRPVLTLSGQSPYQYSYLPTWREFSTHVYHGIMNYAAFPASPENLSFIGPVLHRNARASPACQAADSQGKCSAPKNKDTTVKKRAKRSSSHANSVLLGTLRVMRLINAELCKNIPAAYLKLHGDVAYGKEQLFENQARTALRLAHFISAFNQITDPTEKFFERTADLPLNEQQLFAEVLANVMGDMRILSSGIYYENSKFPGKVYFAPTGERTSRNARAFYAEDYALYVKSKDRSYMKQDWYKAVREQWRSDPAFHLTKFSARMRMRGDRKGTYSTKYDHYPRQYYAPVISDGFWSPPYYNCHGRIKEWVLTYAVPFFGLDSIRQRVEFQGVVTVTVPLPELDLNQCPASIHVPNAFKNSDRCHRRSSYCTPILGRRFEMGGYKCECKPGYEYPFNDPVNYFDGQVMEAEWEKLMTGLPNKFSALKCRLVGSCSRLKPLLILVVAMLCLFKFPVSDC